MSAYEASKLFTVKDTVAVVTGGGSGLGAVSALALDANGAKVVYIMGRREESLKKVAAQATNGSIKTIVCDVTSKDALAAAAAQIKREVGYVNVVHANSGVIGNGPAQKLPSDPSAAEWAAHFWQNDSVADFTRTFEVNCSGAYFTALAFIELLDMGNRKGNVAPKSQIIFTASIAGYSRFMLNGFDYTGSKAAVIQMTKTFASSLAKYKIRVNAIAPGFYPSEMTDGHPIFSQGNDPRKEGGMPQSSCPLERSGSEEDFAGVILSLVSPGGSYHNGGVIVTDGGRLAQIPSAY